MTENAQTLMKGAVRDALSEQIKHKFYSAYLYLSMAGSLRPAGAKEGRRTRGVAG